MSGIFRCAIWFAFCAFSFSDAGYNILLPIVAIPLAMIWAVIWLVRLVAYRKQQRNQSKLIKTKKLLFWMLEPITLIASIVLSTSGLFSYMRFIASESALNHYVESVRSGQVNLNFEFQHPSRHIGLYTVSVTDLLSDGTVRVITSSHSVLDKAGFANSPSSPPPRQGEDSYKHIFGQWWLWYQRW